VGTRGGCAAGTAAAGIRAPVAALFAEARRSGRARRHAPGDRSRAPPGPVRDRPARGGSAGGRDAVDERRRLHPGQPGAARRRRNGLRLPPLGALTMTTRGRPTALMLRWLALGAAAGA